MDVCTIIAKNYLAQARVLARSFAEHHPDVPLPRAGHRRHRGLRRSRGGAVRARHDRRSSASSASATWRSCTTCSSCRPRSSRGCCATCSRAAADSAVVYLDPDMRLYAPLDEMFAAVREHGLVLSPHNLGPMPRDGLQAERAGHPDRGRLQPRLRRDQRRARSPTSCSTGGPSASSATASSTPSAASSSTSAGWTSRPSMAGVVPPAARPAASTSPTGTCTRAPISQRDGALVRRRRRAAAALSLQRLRLPAPRHAVQAPEPHRASARSPTCGGCATATPTRCAPHGVEEVAQLPVHVRDAPRRASRSTACMRRHLPRARRSSASSTRRRSSPRASAAFLERLNAPAASGGAPGVTRYLAELYRSRAGPAARVPGPRRRRRRRASSAGRACGAAARCRSPTRCCPSRRPTAPAPQRAPAAGARAARTPAARRQRRRLPDVGDGRRRGRAPDDRRARRRRHAGAARRAHRAARPPRPRLRRRRRRTAPATRSTSSASTPTCCPYFAADVGPQFFAHRHTIGMWWWEVSEFPERWHGSFELVDEIWAGSRFVADTLARGLARAGRAHPAAGHAAGAPARGARRRSGCRTGFVVPVRLRLQLGARAQEPARVDRRVPARLPGRRRGRLAGPEEHQRRPPPGRPRAGRRRPPAGTRTCSCSTSSSRPADKNRLIVSCDAYVSLHRSEGFGITMAEAMLLGKPVVATDYSGNIDFMTRRELLAGALRRWRRSARAPTPYPADARVGRARPRPRRGVHARRSSTSPTRPRAAARARRGTSRASTRRRRRGSAIAAAAAPEPLDPGAPLGAGRRGARRRPTPRSGSIEPRRRAARRRAAALPGRTAARRALLRTLKPHTAHQAGLDRRAGDGVRELADEVDGSARRLLDVDTSSLRELRALERAARRRSRRRARRPEAALGPLLQRGQRAHRRPRRPGRRAARRAAAPRADASQHRAVRARRAGDRRPELSGGARGAVEPRVQRGATARSWPASSTIRRCSRRFRARAARCPDGFGVGFDERVVEFPWLAAQRLGGTVLDAGSTLNHLHVLHAAAAADGRPAHRHARARRASRSRSSASPTSTPTCASCRSPTDVRPRALDLDARARRDGQHLLRHGRQDRRRDPQRELLAAVAELRRVLRPGGDCYITVPVGDGERFAWVRSAHRRRARRGRRGLRAGGPQRHVLPLHGEGWQVGDREAVAEETYRDHFTSGPVGPDRAVAARAVACLRLTKP